jgi:hypothetical protein
MAFRQGNEPIQAFPSNGPDHALANRIRSRRARRRFEYAQSEPADGLVQIDCEDAVAVVDQVFVPTLVANGLSQLLARPARARVRSHVVVDQAAGLMLDDNEYVEQAECARHRDEEVARHKRLRVVLQERGPSLIPSGLAWRSPHVLADSARWYLQTEFWEQLIGDPPLAPERILACDPADELA